VIALSGEKCFCFQFCDKILRCRQLAIQLFQQIIALVSIALFERKVDVRLDVAGESSQFLVGAYLLFGASAVAQDGLRCFLIAPEVGVGGANFERFQPLALLRRVKDSSARA
jgi:hypothetical protein